MEKIFFDNWESILRTFTITLLAYVSLIFLLRISGKRTLSKMNAFDFIVTIALGSTLASVILNKNVALADGILSFFLLIFLQYIITFLSVRFKSFDAMVKSSPTLMAYKGKMLKEIMLKERVTDDEVYAIIREKGLGELSDAEAVVLETDGSLTVIKKTQNFDSETMSAVKNFENIKSSFKD